MKIPIFRITLGMSLLAACAQPSSKKTAAEEKQPAQQTQPEALLVPGKSAGKFYLQQNMDSIFTLLGKPDDGDAAMGKAWGIWHGKDTIAIYSTYADSTMSSKTVRQIVVSGEGYRTESGIGSNTPFGIIRDSYPAL